MAVTIRIPTALRKLAGGAVSIEADGSNVNEVLTFDRETHPDLGKQLLGEDGKVRRFVNLFANDEDIRFLDDLNTALKDGDELSIVPAIAGGR